METKRFFVGEWELVELSCSNDQDWPLWNKYDNCGITWKFRESGQFIMYSGNSPVKTQLYVYDPEKQSLFLGEKHYQVKYIRDYEYMLLRVGDGEKGKFGARIRKL